MTIAALTNTDTLRYIERPDGTVATADVVVVVNPDGTALNGVTATGVAKAEDAGHTSGDTGIMSLAVRNDTQAAFSGTDLDYTPLAVDSAGRQILAPRGISASATFTPAASAHTAPAVVGGAQQFSLAAPSGGRIKINSVSLEIDGGTLETTTWSLYLYSVTPPSAIADAAAFDIPAGDRASFLAKIPIAQVVDEGSTLYIEASNIGRQIKLAGTSVFGYLVNATTLTPAAVAHIVTINAEVV